MVLRVPQRRPVRALPSLGCRLSEKFAVCVEVFASLAQEIVANHDDQRRKRRVRRPLTPTRVLSLNFAAGSGVNTTAIVTGLECVLLTPDVSLPLRGGTL